MTETDEEDIHNDEPRIYLYVEKRTGLLYEVQMFTDFVLVRSATPEFRNGSLQKLSNNVFGRAFDEYEGDARYFKTITDGFEEPLTVTQR